MPLLLLLLLLAACGGGEPCDANTPCTGGNVCKYEACRNPVTGTIHLCGTCQQP